MHVYPIMVFLLAYCYAGMNFVLRKENRILALSYPEQHESKTAEISTYGIIPNDGEKRNKIFHREVAMNGCKSSCKECKKYCMMKRILKCKKCSILGKIRRACRQKIKCGRRSDVWCGKNKDPNKNCELWRDLWHANPVGGKCFCAYRKEDDVDANDTEHGDEHSRDEEGEEDHSPAPEYNDHNDNEPGYEPGDNEPEHEHNNHKHDSDHNHHTADPEHSNYHDKLPNPALNDHDQRHSDYDNRPNYEGNKQIDAENNYEPSDHDEQCKFSESNNQDSECGSDKTDDGQKFDNGKGSDEQKYSDNVQKHENRDRDGEDFEEGHTKNNTNEYPEDEENKEEGRFKEEERSEKSLSNDPRMREYSDYTKHFNELVYKSDHGNDTACCFQGTHGLCVDLCKCYDGFKNSLPAGTDTPVNRTCNTEYHDHSIGLPDYNPPSPQTQRDISCSKCSTYMKKNRLDTQENTKKDQSVENLKQQKNDTKKQTGIFKGDQEKKMKEVQEENDIGNGSGEEKTVKNTEELETVNMSLSDVNVKPKKVLE